MPMTSPTSTLDKIREQALALPMQDRVELADALRISLEDAADFKLSPAWEAEIARRSEDLRTGRVQGVPHDVIMRELDAWVDGH